jgi:hypothetical protein
MSNTSMDEGDKPHIPRAHLLPQPSLPQTRSDAHIVYPRLCPSSAGVHEREGGPNSKAGGRPMLWYRILRTGQSTIDLDGSGVSFQDLPSLIAKACHTIWAQQPGGCASDRHDSPSTTCLAKIRGKPGPGWGKLSTKGVGVWGWLRSKEKS